MYTAETVAFRRGSTILKLPRSLVYDAVIARLREQFGLVGPVSLYLVNQGSQTLQLPVAESSYDILSRETNAMFDVRGHSTWENPPAPSTSGRPPIYMALAPAAPRSIPGVPPNAPLPRPLSRRSPSPFDPPPPYVRQVNQDEQRKVTFTVSTKLGDQMTLSAQRWVKGMKVFEAACKLLKLQVHKCVLNHNGRSYGVGDMERLSLAEIDVDNGDRLKITWEDVVAHCSLWAFSSSEDSTNDDDTVSVRIAVRLSPEWSFGALIPPTPIHTSRPKKTGEGDVQSRSAAVWNVRTCSDGKLQISEGTAPVERISWQIQATPVVRPAPQLSGQNACSSNTGELQIAGTSGTQVDGLRTLPSLTSINGNNRSPWTEFPPLVVFASILARGYIFLIQLFTVNLASSETIGKVKQAFVKFPNGTTPVGRRRDGIPVDNTFDMSESSSVLLDNNSVLLSGGKVGAYLRVVLKGIGIPSDVIDSFVSQRSTQFASHKHVALRFLSTNALTQASVLRVTPEPDALVRVFLLYTAVLSEDVERKWSLAKSRGEKIEAHLAWRDVILGKNSKVEDHGLRVLELGWMEVHQDDD